MARGLREVSMVLAVAALAALAAGDHHTSPPEVDVSTGKLRGKWMETDSGRAVAAFEGIPFAQAPVGALRFKAPQPARPWSGVKVADRVSEMCLQRNLFLQRMEMEGSEDCLYMNVYAPETVSRSQPLPVMVYVHGGGFFSGCGSIHGPEYLLDKDVLLVNFNYRLGPLGFLSTSDEVIPGNFGLKDMVLALRWVRDNVRAFGGDPDLVTIFGESAGGASVHFLMLSPLSKGLFHRAAAMSGSALALWAFRDAPLAKQQVGTFAGALGCPAQPSEDLLKCLAGKTAEEIQGTDVAFMKWLMHPMVPFRPTAEPSGPDAFLDKIPAIAALEASDVPFMTGVTTDEGCIGTVALVENPQLASEYGERFDELSPMMFGSDHLPAKLNKETYGRLRKLYFGDKPIDATAKQAMMDFFTDGYFSVPVLEAVKVQKKVAKSPVFMYEVAHRSDRSWALAFGAKKAAYGTCHADDLLYLFPLREIFPQEASESNKAFSRQFVDLFTTFARTGSPTQDGSWPAVRDGERPEYVHLAEAGPLQRRSDYNPDRIKVWAGLPVNVGLTSLASAPKDEL